MYLHEYEKALADFKQSKKYGIEKKYKAGEYTDYAPKTEIILADTSILNAEGWRRRGATFREYHDYEKAIECHSKAIEMQPNFARAYANRARAYLEMKEYEKAVDDLTKAIEIAPSGQLPEEGAYFCNRAIAYAMLKQYDKAVADDKKALSLNPDSKTAQDNLKKDEADLAKNAQPAAADDSLPPPLPSERKEVKYFAAINGKREGPFDWDALQAKVDAGDITQDTLVWKKSMADWAAAKDAAELAPLFAELPPPLPV
jgi:tetratricopeptide (TPR) repeat protein